MVAEPRSSEALIRRSRLRAEFARDSCAGGAAERIAWIFTHLSSAEVGRGWWGK